MKTKRLIKNTFVHILLAILSIIWVSPIFYVVLTSLREEGGSYKSYIWPRGFTLNNYINLFDANSAINFEKWFMNT